MTKEVAPTINQGPSGKLDKYIHCLGRTDKAIDFFERTNKNSSELTNAKQLKENGIQNMEHHLISVLKRHSNPVDAESIHKLITEKEMKKVGGSPKKALSSKGDASPSAKKGANPPKMLTELIILEISKVAEWLTNANKASNNESAPDYAKKYAEVRSEIVQKSVGSYQEFVSDRIATGQDLRSSQRRKSQQSGNSGGADGKSPHLGIKANVNRRTSRAQDSKGSRVTTLRRAAVARKQTLDAQASHMPNSHLTLQPHMSLAPQISTADSTEYTFDEESGDILKSELQALIELLKLERFLVEKLIPSKNQTLIKSVFSQICSPCLADYKSKIDAIAKWGTDRLNKKDYKACMDMMPIADYIRLTTPTLLKMVSDCDIEVKDTVRSKMKNMNFSKK